MRSVFFGPFRLEIRPHPHDPAQTVLRLFRDGQLQKAGPLRLRLLAFMADDHPGEELTIDEIAAAVWPIDTGGDNVEKQISLLREVLGDTRLRPVYIATVRDSGAYKFIAPVRAEGDLQRLIGFPRWNNLRLLEFFGKIRRDEQHTEDLRIVTTGLVPSRQDLDYEEYLQAGIRIRIVMVNPENTELLKCRYALRRDRYRTEQAQADITDQIDSLRIMIDKYPNDALQVCISNTMPSGLIFHTRDSALLGMFPAQGSYILGPMIHTAEKTMLWRTLYDDWKVRWDNPAKLLTSTNLA
jgi:DNA-binding winged helix-turn-helix (wHTH) protein